MAATDGSGTQSSGTWQNEERLRDDVSLNCACRISPGLIGFDSGLDVALFNPEHFYRHDGIAACDQVFYHK